MDLTSFPGLPKEGFRFLAELGANNNRPWFKAHEQRYKAALKEPAEALELELAEALEERFGLEFRSKIFRLNRDLRFSKDKTPYNLYIRMSFCPAVPGQRNGVFAEGHLGLYLSLEAEKIMTGCGVFGFSKDQLETYRQALLTKAGKELAALVETATLQGQHLFEPDLKKLPAPFGPDFPYPDLAKRKGLSLWREEPVPPELHGPEAVRFLADRLGRFSPLWAWLLEYLYRE